MSELYCTATNTTQVTSATVTGNHDSPVSTAMIEAIATGLTLGDAVSVDLGYSDDHRQVFTGYVKTIERKISPGGVSYVITAYDNLVRAQDFFIASTNPMTPYKNKGVLAENLVRDLLAMAGLTNYAYTPTYFTFGINNEFEVNLVSVYDYIRTICDTLTWTLWASDDGKINFKNRKPYVMMGDTGQPGDTPDTPTGFVIDYSNAIDISYAKSERSLRNRVVVYGSENVYAEAKTSSSALPDGFYKSAVLAMPQLIDSQSLADSIADYNLDLLNRITEAAAITLIGTPSLDPRTVISMNIPSMSLTGNWYLFGVDHQWNSSGYTCNVDLRRMLRDT